MLDESLTPLVREDLQYRGLDDGGVIYDTAAEQIYTLNITAAYIWNCCDGSRNVSQIASELISATNVPREKAMADVVDAITYFERQGLLQSQ